MSYWLQACMKRVLLLQSLAAGLVMCAAGCGDKLPANPTTYPVYGTVTFDGEPVPGGQVKFKRTDGVALEGMGNIHEDGSYRANAFPQQDGMVPGEYAVWLEQRAGKPQNVPLKFFEADTAGMSYTVKPEDNEFDIELRSAE